MKSRVKGDFHARFRGNAGVKFPCVTRLKCMETPNNYNDNYLEFAHKSCSSHKTEILTADLCGCFYCKQTFLPSEIDEWIEEKIGETAICPKCGIDSILSSKFPITDKLFFDRMNKYFFRQCEQE